MSVTNGAQRGEHGAKNESHTEHEGALASCDNESRKFIILKEKKLLLE